MPSLIVVSATGSSAVGAILLGSNARRVVRICSLPVLVLPPAARSTPGAFLRRARALRPGPPASRQAPVPTVAR
jgi:hypothetical protein